MTKYLAKISRNFKTDSTLESEHQTISPTILYFTNKNILSKGNETNRKEKKNITMH